MPLVSQAQARWAYANQGNKTREGAAARDFIAASPGGPGSVKKLPKFKKPSVRRPGPGMPGAQPFGSLAPGGGMDPGAPPIPPDGEMQ